MLNNLLALISMCRGGFPIQKYAFLLWFQQIQAYILSAAKILIKLKIIHSDTQVYFMNRQHTEVVGISLDGHGKQKGKERGHKQYTILAASARVISVHSWPVFGPLLCIMHLKYNVNIE